jgi:DNA-directed RNA polymerase subunit M/transcription elongation factor TFIIS
MSNHSHSSALSHEALTRLLLNGEPLSPAEQHHLAHCASCQQQLSDYRRLHQILRAYLYRTQCPDVEQLGLYSADMLPQEQRQQIAQHIEQCPRCARESAVICQFLTNSDLPSASDLFYTSENFMLR